MTTCRTSSRKSVPNFTNRHPRARVHRARVHSRDRKRNQVAAPSKARAHAAAMAMWSTQSSKSSTKTRKSNEFTGDISTRSTCCRRNPNKQAEGVNKMAAVNVKPLGDRVLVQPIEETEVKKGGIIIPDTAKEKPQEGKVVALGTGKVNEEGKKVDFTVKKGDKVLISKYGGTEIKVDGESYLIMREDDILGIIG